MKTARVIVALTLVFLLIVAIASVFAVSRRARAHAECEHQMRFLAAALSAYSLHDAKGRYPELSPNLSQFHLQEKFISEWEPQTDSKSKTVIDETRYWYLGWVIPNERSGLEWLEHYRKHAPDFCAIPEVEHAEIWPEYKDDIEARDKVLVAEWEKQGRAGKGKPSAGPLMGEFRFYMPLSEGIGRFLITAIGHPGAIHEVNSQIPILFERPEFHGDGSHVLFMDGHIQFMRYPSGFPMSPNFIEALRSLDVIKH
jgi:prepilin-type processing-associated H-X9-DG protein